MHSTTAPTRPSPPSLPVPVGRLDLSGSPRLGGTDRQHVSTLAQIAASALPPVLVHRATLRVIDGVHRVHAAIQRGDATIAAELIDCDEAEVFIRAVQANARHGLPLSLEDRRAAGGRILEARPQWSDRMIAKIVGLSPNTIGAIRRRRADAIDAATTHRLGLDGRLHRLGPADTRQAVREALARNPTASVRELAGTVGISVGRAHVLRREMLCDKPPEPAPAEHAARVIPGSLVRLLAADPSLRHNEQGRGLLRLLATQPADAADWSDLADVVPAHRMTVVIELAESFSDRWGRFADELKRRSTFG